MNDTIFALSSGRGASGVAVIRISGENLGTFFESLTHDMRTRYAHLIDLKDETGDLIDKCIAIYFKSPSSFTGEDVIELHTHGAPAVIDAVCRFLSKKGFRMAERGEFSRRAFYNGKMDLIEADGLANLLCAKTDAQRKFALRAAIGADSAVFESWRSNMIEIAAYAAAILDYPSDELPGNIIDRQITRTQKLYDEISSALQNAYTAHAITAGFNVVIAGPVNAGKSSLFNRLVGSARAIVSDIPGTTRDVVSAEIDMDGYLVRLSDTAGLRDTKNKIEKMGIDMTNTQIENADLILRVTDKMESIKNNKNEIIVHNKSDLHAEKNKNTKNSVYVSATTSLGIPELLVTIKKFMHEKLDNAESDVIVSARAKTHLQNAQNELKAALNSGQSLSPDLFAHHVQIAADSIGRILGKIDANEVSDAVFGQLCLGK